MKKYIYFLPVVFCLVQCNLLPASRNELFQRAVHNDSLRNCALSVRIYDSLLAIYPGDLPALINRGRAKVITGDTLGALDDLDKAIRAKPLWQALYVRSHIRMALGRHDVLGDLSAALRLSPNNSLIIAETGYYYDSVDPTPDSALHYADWMMELKNPDPEGYFMPMNVYMHNRRYDELNRVADSIIKYQRPNAFVYNNKGFAEMHLGLIDRAREDIQTSLRIDSANSYAWKNMGLLCLTIHKNDSACILFKKAQSLGYRERYGNEVDSLIQRSCHGKTP